LLIREVGEIRRIFINFLLKNINLIFLKINKNKINSTPTGTLTLRSVVLVVFVRLSCIDDDFLSKKPMNHASTCMNYQSSYATSTQEKKS
jgi:hypothetical protein